jgi:pyruvate,orthophosphate dikinase
VFDADTAEMRGRQGEKIILVREETKPEDIHGFFAGQSASSPAAAARPRTPPWWPAAWASPAFPAARPLVDVHQRIAPSSAGCCTRATRLPSTAAPAVFSLGEVPTVEPEFSRTWRPCWLGRRGRTLKVMANADTPTMPKARGYGAMGIGLCRTERMFNANDRLPIVQEMILAETTEDREAALAACCRSSASDFKEIFKAMKGLPVTVRLLDPPIHEFLPSEQTRADRRIEHLRHLRQTVKAVWNCRRQPRF